MAAALVGRLLLLSFVLHLTSAGILYPRESERRELKTLDGIWQFRAADGNEGIEQKWFKTRLSDTGPTMPMPVPSSYNDITQDKELREHVGTVWYERTFYVPDSWKGNSQRVWLRFGSVNYAAHVWLNGEAVMQHEIGHLPFQAEVTRFLRFGQENRVTVQVDNIISSTSIPQGGVIEIPTINGTKKVLTYGFDFFHYSGIHRPVVLYTTPATYVDDITTVTEIDGTTGVIKFDISYVRAPESYGEITCNVTVLDAQGKVVANVEVDRTSGNECTGSIQIPNAHLWWPYLMDPSPGYLYTLEVRLVTGNARWTTDLDDVYRLPVGIRTVTWSNTTLYINNVPAYLRGFGRHEDSDIRGKGLDLALVAKDYNLLKWVGANAYRTSHYPYAEEIMDFADQQGIMIIDECPSVDTNGFTSELLTNHKSSLTQVIHRDKNRPSVIMWSVANEPVTANPKSAEYFKAVVEHVKSLDKTRPVTSALNQDHTNVSQEHAAQYMDILGVNRYNSWYTDPGKLEVIQPQLVSLVETWYNVHKKPIMILEYGADTMPGLHLDPSYMWTEEYQMDLFSEHFKSFDALRAKGYFVGEFIWNFADFKTDQTYTRVGGNMKGIFTRQRQPKTAAFQVRKRYFQLASEVDGYPLPGNLDRYTSDLR